jgi:hypothetical protein
MKAQDLFDAAAQIPSFKGMGLGAKFVHVDVRETEERALWSYDSNGKAVPFHRNT